MKKDEAEKSCDTRKQIMTGFSALLSEFIYYPIHTVWTVQQEQSVKKPLSFISSCQYIRKNMMQYSDLYKGFTISGAAAMLGIYPYLYGAHQATAIFGNNQFGYVMQGPMAQAFSSVIYVPAMRLVEIEQATITNKTNKLFNQSSLFRKSRHLWKMNGVAGFYRGAFSQWCNSAFNDALAFWARAMILNTFEEKNRHHMMPQLFASSLGFAFAYGLATPFMIVQTRLRIHEINPKQFPDTTFKAAFKTLYRERGVRGLFYSASTSSIYGVVSSVPIALESSYR